MCLSLSRLSYTRGSQTVSVPRDKNSHGRTDFSVCPTHIGTNYQNIEDGSVSINVM